MMDAQEIFDALAAPFPSEEISWRIGSTRTDDGKVKGQCLAYIDARTVMDRLDAVVGMENWQCNYTAGVGGSIVCNIGLCINEQWIWKADGAGASNFEAEKGALSDAFKRAAVRFGIARYLYDMKSPWVDVPSKERAYIQKPDLERLEKYHTEYARRLMVRKDERGRDGAS